MIWMIRNANDTVTTYMTSDATDTPMSRSSVRTWEVPPEKDSKRRGARAAEQRKRIPT